ncbi:hypothetical protein CES85_4187 [Ochrobactrum quorumnocens]|uniref:Uncharacterized protein n=1 Tax=Ochrobactrum quorumnocens TaxID=271865 RepID=A0A248U9E4_9HYPH|nr:hypothetical protein CES85_4187 [[Ochrobactrum] quorumnocens]
MLKPLYRFAFTHYPTQKAHSLLLENALSILFRRAFSASAALR